MKKFDQNFLKVCEELEKLDKTFLIKEVPEEYSETWFANNEIRLWQIPRTSAKIIKFIALSNKSKVILELGTSAGYSALWLASAASQFQGRVYTIEIVKTKIKIAKKFFQKAKLDKYITQIEGEISEVLKKWTKKIDLVFIDADKTNYLAYIKQVEPFLKKGSVVIADNALDQKSLIKNYLNYVSHSSKYYSFLLRIDNGLMISVKL